MITGYAFVMPSQPAGFYFIGRGLRVAVYKKPRWLTRALVRILLEREWEDAK